METNIKRFIDGIKPTSEMNEKELRTFSEAARNEIKRLIDQEQYTASERDELAAQLAEAKDKIETVTDENCELNERLRKLEEKLKKSQEDAEYWQKSWVEVYGKYNELKSQLSAISTIITALTK